CPPSCGRSPKDDGHFSPRQDLENRRQASAVRSVARDILAGWLIQCVATSDEALHQRTGEPMLADAAGRLTGAIETRNDLAHAINDLAPDVDTQAGTGIVWGRCRPRGMERRFQNRVGRTGLAEIGVDP